MFNDTTKSTAKVLVVAGFVLIAGAGPAAAASPTVDSETTNTATTSALTDGYTQSDFNASENVNLSTLQANYDSSNPGVWIKDADSGDIVNKVTNETHPDRWTQTDSTNDYWNVTLSEHHFGAVPMDAGQNKSVTLVLVNNTSSANPDFTNITVYLNNTDERAVVFAGESSDDGGIADVEEEEVGTLEAWLGKTADNISTVEADNVGIANETTDVFVVYGDDTVSEPYADAAENKSTLWGLSSASIESGDRIPDHLVTVEGTHYAVYEQDAPDDVADMDEATYGEFTTVSGYDAHRVELGDTYEDETTVDVVTTSEEDLDAFEEVQTFGDSGFFGMAVGGSGLVATS